MGKLPVPVDRSLLLIRSPYDCILSNFNRKGDIPGNDTQKTYSSRERFEKSQYAVEPTSSLIMHCLVGLVVKASASRTEDPGFESRLRRDFFRGRVIPVTSKLGTPVATLPGAWRYRVSARTGWPGVSIL